MTHAHTDRLFDTHQLEHFFLHLLTAIVVALFCGLIASPARARHAQRQVYVVSNDRGGVVSTRQNEIQDIAVHGQKVEIRGAVCLSSCTMFLGAPDVCVHPQTSFGFHGPSDHGRPLKPAQFEYWSQVIASYYPRKLAQWYLKTGRYTLRKYHRLTGAQLVAYGIPRC
ncbi:hypothetical protein [Thalassovita sp.]|uniref:hypothetical protein n=1 Tax=Thalassovita sp. TaxID=1979401 RepID=UPI002882765B|nr:hypothetical protein [Thalassovita sp.]MDF1803905.1 hypothetical protein [Thalassovita sp.]